MHQKIPLPGVIFAVLMVLLNLMGLYDFAMSLGLHEGYFSSQGYGNEATEFFRGFPFLFTALWFISLVSGIVAPVLFLMKSKFMELMAFLAMTSYGLFILLTTLFRGRIAALGFIGFVIDVSLLALLVLFYLYSRQMNRKLQGAANHSRGLGEYAHSYEHTY
ncbi:hypothetical protein [Corynebacterium freiburgense]|uniref:hypothetical protein n=1 Tax=Corynebacterium freiburgense TaxID=556548 RepID=UPI00040AB5AE|nr:hypothetical protein [Corynebacterium freiburgense]WJZ02402.1 hypothetical protein CFREI_05535 [Corynebacterium freiburgense]